MKIIDLLNDKKVSLSFEVFPPKTSDNYDTVKNATEEIAKLSPAFMSVTYGAGGGTSDFTVDIATNLLKNYGVTPLAHLTCLSSTKDKITGILDALKKNGIENILALRGDLPAGMTKESLDFTYASDLVTEIRKYGDFCIGGA